MKKTLLALGLGVAISMAATIDKVAFAGEIELLPDGLLEPTSKERVEAGLFKKKGPWTIGMSFGGVGNSWIVQMIQEAKYTGRSEPRNRRFHFC